MEDKIKIMIVDDEPLIRKAIKYEVNESRPRVECGMNDDGEVKLREVEVAETFASGKQLFTVLDSNPELRPDYLLVDMEFQGEPTGGISITERVRKSYRRLDGGDIQIIIISGRFDNPLPTEHNRTQRIKEIGGIVFEALQKGASAFVSKNATSGFSVENILRAISCLERGEECYFNYPVMLTLKEAAEMYFTQGGAVENDLEISEEEREILLLEAGGYTAQEIATRLIAWNETDKSIQDKQRLLAAKFGIVNKSGARIAKAIQYGIIDTREIKYIKK